VVFNFIFLILFSFIFSSYFSTPSSPYFFLHERRVKEAARKLERHRRVIPENRPHDGVPGQELFQERPDGRGPARGGQGGRQVGDDDEDAAIRTNLQRWHITVEERFFEEEHPGVGRAARHQMLRALEHEVPSQV